MAVWFAHTTFTYYSMRDSTTTGMLACELCTLSLASRSTTCTRFLPVEPKGVKRVAEGRNSISASSIGNGTCTIVATREKAVAWASCLPAGAAAWLRPVLAGAGLAV